MINLTKSLDSQLEVCPATKTGHAIFQLVNTSRRLVILGWSLSFPIWKVLILRLRVFSTYHHSRSRSGHNQEQDTDIVR